MIIFINRISLFKILFSLFIFIFSFALIMAGNSVGDEKTEFPTVMTFSNNDVVSIISPSIDEGMPKNQSNFPENPEDYVPLPIPEPIEQTFSTQGENKLISYNVITGEENVSESPPPMIEEMLTSGWVKGNMAGGIVNQKNIQGEGIIENEYASELKNFSTLSMIANPEDYPWRVNAKIYISFAGGNYVASGVLIDPMHVLTAGHCVHDVYHGGTWATSIVVVPAYENGLLPYGDATSAYLWSWSGWVNDMNFDHDLGVIVLDRPIGALTSWHGYGYNNDPTFYTGGNVFNNAGYPAESPYTGEYMYYWYGPFDFAEYSGGWYGEEVGFNSRAYGGQSGSGVYIISGDYRYVYAVISNGTTVAPYYTKCPRITSSKFGDISSTIIGNNTPSTFDLIPLDVTSSPSTITAGNQLSSMSYFVHNYSSASWSGTVNVNVYLSTNEDISTGDLLIQTHSFTWSFSAKSTVQVNVGSPPTIPITTAEDDYFLGIILNITDDDSGNNDSDGQDASPIYVLPEGDPPPAPVISSPTHPDEDTWYSDDDPTFNWTTPSDSSGIAGYSYTLNNSPSTTPDTVIDTTGNSLSISNVANGEWYFHVRARDNAGNWGSADHYRVRIDDASPGTPTISSPTHSDEDTWYSDDDPTFNWTTPSDPSGIAGYSYTLNNSPSTTPDTAIDTSGNSWSASNVANGEWYFHVRARDNAGNWGSADHYRVRIDDASPGTPIISSPTHSDEDTWYSDDDPTFNWTTPSDPSGIAGYSGELDNSPSTTPDTVIDTTGNSLSISNVANGEWYFHVRARDNAGNWGSADHYRVRIDDTPPIIDPITNHSIPIGTPYTGPTPSLSQSGPSPLTWSLEDGPSGMSINGSTGVVSWLTPTVAGSPHSITIRATNTAGFDDESWQLTVTTVSVPPVIDPIPDDSIPEGTPYTGPTPSLSQGTFPVTWSLEDGPSGMSINASTGVVSWPTPTVAGSPHSITIRATNTAGFDDESWQLTVTVTGITNNPPVLDPIGNQVVVGGELLEFTITATDPDDDNLAFSVINLPDGATLTDHGNGTATIEWQTSVEDIPSIYSNITFTVTDDGSPSLIDSETITIAVVAAGGNGGGDGGGGGGCFISAIREN